MSSYHKSSFIEKLASNFRAIDNILLFRKCHPTLTNSIFTVIAIVIIGLGVICIGAFLKGLELYVLGVGVIVFIVTLYFIWKKPKPTAVIPVSQSTERYYRSEQENRRRSDYGNNLKYGNRYSNTVGYSNKSNHRVIKIVVVLIIAIYLVIVVGGTLSIQPLYDTMQRVISLSDSPVQFIEKTFWEHMKVMLMKPWEAWHYIFADESTMYRELMIEYSASSGIDISAIEKYLRECNILE